ncbi:MAG: DUF2752 domain-containing protein [Bacteroidia bacterium]|nr:DUF2752 domain-containing protein [Bacteroidia bacterium]
MGFLLGGFYLWLLPASYFDTGVSSCIWKRAWGIECPGCGLTRGTQHMLHGEWEIAIDYHPFSPFTTLLLTFAWGANIVSLYRLWRNREKTYLPLWCRLKRWFSS